MLWQTTCLCSSTLITGPYVGLKYHTKCTMQHPVSVMHANINHLQHATESYYIIIIIIILHGTHSTTTYTGEHAYKGTRHTRGIKPNGHACSINNREPTSWRFLSLPDDGLNFTTNVTHCLSLPTDSVVLTLNTQGSGRFLHRQQKQSSQNAIYGYIHAGRCPILWPLQCM